MTENEPPVWDEEAAARLDGALVLVGITYLRPAGPEQVQFFGTVISVDRSGITLRLGGEREGESYELPPALEAFEPAPPGEYRLRSTGEIVTDPDYTTSWEITPPMN